MSKKRTIDTLARTLDRHLAEMGMGSQELVDLACALIDHATQRAQGKQSS